MFSICSACEMGFDGKLKEFYAWQLPGVKCLERDDPLLCKNRKCKYYWPEDFEGDDEYGCARFIVCDECLKDPKIFPKLLKDYLRIVSNI